MSGIAELVFSAIQTADIDMRNELYKHIGQFLLPFLVVNKNFWKRYNSDEKLVAWDNLYKKISL